MFAMPSLPYAANKSGTRMRAPSTTSRKNAVSTRLGAIANLPACSSRPHQASGLAGGSNAGDETYAEVCAIAGRIVALAVRRWFQASPDAASENLAHVAKLTRRITQPTCLKNHTRRPFGLRVCGESGGLVSLSGMIMPLDSSYSRHHAHGAAGRESPFARATYW